MSRTRMIIAGVAIAIIGGGWYLISRNASPPAGQFGPPGQFGPGRGGPPRGGGGFNFNQAATVRTVPAVQEDLSLQVRSIGTVVPFNTVVVRSRVDGPLLRVLFEEGQRVRAGELLAEIDPEPYRIRLAQAEGAQQQNLAQLRNAELELEQYRRVIEAGTIPRQTLDRQEALVAQLRGTIKSDQAQVDQARLQLGYTRITAPIAGRVGLRRVDPGNLVSATGTEGLVTITQTQPISVLLTIPEAELPALRAGLAEHGSLPVQAWDRSGRQHLATGSLRTLDNQIDTATGTLRLKAEFQNADDTLFPNQFVNTVLEIGKLQGAVTVPTDAIQHGSRGTYVYVVNEGVAQLRDVRVGPTVEGRTAVLEGVAAGESVVLEGMDRLRDGSPVTVVNGDGPAEGRGGPAEGRGPPAEGGGAPAEGRGPPAQGRGAPPPPRS